LHSPSFVRETNPEQLEHNGDQPFLAIFSAFLDNNIKPTQTFGNTFTPFINTDSHANIEFAKCLSSKKTCNDFTMNGLYALLIFSPSPYLAMTIQCLTAWRFPS